MIYVLLALLLSPLLVRRRRLAPGRILVIQTAKIGDFVCTTPLLRSLDIAFPDAEITALVSPPVVELAEQLPFIDRTIACRTASLKGWRGKIHWARQLRNEGFDMVFCCNGGSVWPVVSAWAGIPVRIGLAPNFIGKSTALAQRLWTRSVPHDGNRLIAETYAGMLSAIGVERFEPAKTVFASPAAKDKALALFPKDGTPSIRIGIAVSSGNKLKELGVPLIARVCRDILEEYPEATLVLLGTGEDRAKASEVIDAVGAVHRARVVDSCGAFALREVPGLISALHLFIGVDSGLTYIADALEIPLVSIAGPCNMSETRPVNAHAILLQKAMPCAPCAHIFRAPYSCRMGTRACIGSISADDVMTEVRHLLRRGQIKAG